MVVNATIPPTHTSAGAITTRDHTSGAPAGVFREARSRSSEVNAY
jgi:hypothetical protein